MKPTREWRPIPGYEATYRVSSLGEIYSVPRPRTRGGLLKVKVGKRGYPAVSLVQNGQQKTHEVHRLVAAAFLGPKPDGALVRHIDGDPLRPHADNLRYGTWSENLMDQIEHGTHPTASRRECPQGHPYDTTNTRHYQGRRYCKACHRERTNRRHRRSPDYRQEWKP